MNFLKKKNPLFLLLFLLLFISTNSCLSFQKSDKRIYKQFKKVNKTPQIFRENYQNKTIRYIATKPIDNNLPHYFLYMELPVQVIISLTI